MKRVLLSAISLALFASAPAFADEHHHWGYNGMEGPVHWAELESDYATCATGKNQSPVNLTGMLSGTLAPLEFDYREGGYEVVNNGHAVQVNYQPGSSLMISGHQYELKQFHFHSPSENLIEGDSFPMEAHFVHSDAEGNLAVVAVMFNVGEENKELDKAWSVMPDHADMSQATDALVSAAALLPENHDYYRFNGSLTTPPCSEGVTWVVMKTADEASMAQIQTFLANLHHTNNRPVQPLNARVIVQ